MYIFNVFTRLAKAHALSVRLTHLVSASYHLCTSHEITYFGIERDLLGHLPAYVTKAKTSFLLSLPLLLAVKNGNCFPGL